MNMTFTQYPKSELLTTGKWAELISMTVEQVLTLNSEWKTIELNNRTVLAHNQAELTRETSEISNFLTAKGIKTTKPGRKLGARVPEKFFEEICTKLRANYNLYSPSMPYCHMATAEVNGVKLSICKSPTTLVELYAMLISQMERATEIKKAIDTRVLAAMKVVVERNLDITGLNQDEVVSMVTNLLKEEYAKTHLVNGFEIAIDDNYCECEGFTIGNDRCDCGNRRISAWVEGDLLGGFYIATEPN